jgi:hypothetical protein
VPETVCPFFFELARFYCAYKKTMQKLIVLLAALVAFVVAEQLPIVLWHGMGDSCCFPFSMGRIQTLIQNQFNETVPMHSVMMGSSIVEDVAYGYLMVTFSKFI